jgi:RNA polymerase sigma-70 factor (ECF subfamily)
MATISFPSAINTLAPYISVVEGQTATPYSKIYDENCHRIYSLAFWMTDNELTAEQLSANTFLRAFASANQPTAECIDRALLAEVRELVQVGTLTLNCAASPGIRNIHVNIKRIHLERALVQLPATEKMIFLMHDVEGYEHGRVAHLLGISEEESQLGLHQARLQIRELVAQMS